LYGRDIYRTKELQTVNRIGTHLQAGVNSLNIKKRRLQMGNIDYENYHL